MRLGGPVGLLLLCTGFAHAGGGLPVITEVHQAPAAGFAEFIELSNPSAEDIALSGWELSGAVSHVFPGGARIRAFASIVLAADPERFRTAYGFATDGRYSGTLPGEAGTVTLARRDGGFTCRASWSLEPGSLARNGGASLELLSPELDGGDPASWMPSLALGGTPREENSRRISHEADPVVPQRDVWRYWKGLSEPPGPVLAWMGPGYDDGSWLTGRAPIGYGNLDDATPLPDMRSSYTAVYLRRAFRYRAPEQAVDAVLWTVFDDGFVAYVNGVEVARRNLGEPGVVPSHDAVASARQEAEGIPEEIRIADVSSVLREGANVLAVVAANDHVRSTDFAIHPALTVTASARPQLAAPQVVLNEAWVEGGQSFVEIYNAGAGEVDLSGFRILGAGSTDGASDVVLPPGARVAGGGFRAVEMPVSSSGDKVILTGFDRHLLVDAAMFPPPLAGASSGRFPDGDPRIRLLPLATREAPNAAPVPGPVVITEIHYNPLDPEAELVELLAREDVDLGGWSLEQAVRFEFPEGTALKAGGRIAVARDPNRIAVDDPAVVILGPYRGRLANDAEEILLADREGRPIDRVRYADDGTWPREADGGGPSLELVDASRENEAGAAWRASLLPGGTPGRENSVAALDSPPVIDFLGHEPLVPGPKDAVTVSARVEPADARADLLWRLDGEPTFRRSPMTAVRDLLHAAIPPQAEGTVVEFAIEAVGGASRGGEVSRFPAGDPGTCLYPVDGRRDSVRLRTYRIVLRAKDLEALQADVTSNETRPATFVALGKAFHDVRVRYRGHGSRFADPKSYRVRFTEENPFEGMTVILLNGFNPERQVMGMDLWRRAGMPYSRARAVQLVLAGQFFPRYAQMEPIDDDYLERHFGDADGNLYRGLRTADFSFLGDASTPYEELYEKHTNEEARDWSDVIDLARAFSLSTDTDFPAVISSRVDTGEWIRWFALNAVLSNQEGGIHRDTGDDYFMYRPPGGRFVLLPWDMDSTYLEPAERIFRPSLPAIRRLITHPDFAPLYFKAVAEVLESCFTPEDIARQAALIEPAFGAGTADEMVTFARERSAFIARSTPSRLTAGVARDGWGSGNDLYATAAGPVLAGTAPALETARVTVNGVEAAYVPWTASWTFDFRLPGPESRVRIAALNASGAPIATRDAVVHRLDGGHVVSALPPGKVEWARGGSPYVVTESITVEEGSELLIGEGSRVIAARDAVLRVEGALRVEGSAKERVVFEAAESGGPWKGLRFTEGSTGDLSRCDFLFDGSSSTAPETPAEPFILAARARVNLRSSTFRDLPMVAVEVVDGALEVTDSSFQRTLEAIHGVRSTVIALRNFIESVRGDSDGIDLDGDPPGGAERSRLEENTILGGDDDGLDLLGSSALLRGNFVRGCADRGISVEGAGTPLVEGNVVSGCSSGLALKDGTAATGGHNTITGCLTGLHAFIKEPGSSGASGDFHSSIVWGNGRDVVVDSASTLSLDHSDVGTEPARWGAANLTADPLFVGPDDFRLRAVSPGASAGRDGSVQGALGVMDPRSPVIAAIEPEAGPPGGGGLVTIRGTGLEGFLEARIGGNILKEARWLAAGTVQGVVPGAARAGSVSVEVTTRTGYALRAAGYRYTKRLPRGDVTGDLKLDVSDAVALLRRLFAGGPPAPCEAVADLDGVARPSVEDALFLLRYLFASGPAPEGLFADCE